MRRIILDTNFLLIPLQFNIDVFSEIRRIADFNYNLCIIDKTIDELEQIIKTSKKQKYRKQAKMAIALLDSEDISKIKTKKDKIVDDHILDIVKKTDIVATQDIELKRKLRKKDINIITLRQKRYLVLQ